MSFVEKIYKGTESFPKYEVYGVVNQMRRAAVSIPSNIAEGAGRQTRKEFIQFLYTSRGSLSEFDAQLQLSKRLGYIQAGQLSVLDADMIQIDKMLNGLIAQLRHTVKGKK